MATPGASGHPRPAPTDARSSQRRRVAVLISAWSLSLSAAIFGQSARPAVAPDSILSRPVTPGTVALLVEHGAVPGVQTRLSDVLRDPNPDVRAAAARVIFVLGLGQLVPSVAAALARESDAPAAIDEARVLAYFQSPVQDAVIWEAVARVGPGKGSQMTLVIAGARGAAALESMPQLRASGATEESQAAFVRVATRGDRAALAALASEAARQHDAPLLSATLRAALNAETDLGDDVLALTLAPDSTGDVRRAGLWHFLRSWKGQSPLSDRLSAAMIAAAQETASHQPDAVTMLGLEVAGRVMGRAARTDAVWTAMIAAPSGEVRRAFSLRSVRAQLTDRELEAASRALYGKPNELLRPDAKDTAAAASAPVAGAAPLMRTISGYPHGFVSGVFAATGCNLKRPGQAVAGVGELTLRRDGRAQRVSLSDTRSTPDCALASRVLLMTYTADAGRLIEQGQRELVLVPFDEEFVACGESAVLEEPVTDKIPDGERVAAPKKTKDVRPIYPESAQQAGVKGTVVMEALITTKGCISRAAVVRSVDVRLDWAGLQAVLGWKFTPTRLNGAPVPVTMTVSAQFNLQ